MQSVPVATVREVDLISESTPVTSDHKTRFGKPVSEPNLAEDIKGQFSVIIMSDHDGSMWVKE